MAHSAVPPDTLVHGRGPVAPLAAVGRADVALAGGKGANLGELVRCGLPVPDGFVVTTEAYATVLRSAGLRAAGEADGGYVALRSAIETVPIPEALRVAIAEAYVGLGGGAVAVRSSATAEDLPGAAFAGQQDTYLSVTGEVSVLDAVRRCWASLWTERAVAYRCRRRIDDAQVHIAVVVQRMVDAEFAGVLFTADPVTGDRARTVIDASSGLGEAVVSGLVTPDHYVLDKHGTVLARSFGRREVVLHGRAAGGVSRRAGDPEEAEHLPEEMLGELVRLGEDVARHFGRPQDIEWAYADGRVWLVQARPMTALPPPPLRLNRRQRRLGAVLLEYVPVRPYPIDMSTWLPEGPAGLMAAVLAHFGVSNAFEGFLIEQDGVVDRLVPPSPRPTLGVVRGMVRFVRLARRYDPRQWTADPRLADYLALVRELADRDVPTLAWPDLVALPREALAAVRPVADLRIAYLPRTAVAVLRLLLVLVLLRRQALLGDLIAGAPTRTREANRALEALAAQVRADPRLRALVDTVDSFDARELAPYGRFTAAVADFLAEYGHRETSSPLLVTPPTLGEAPEIVLGLLRVLVRQQPGDTDVQPAVGEPPNSRPPYSQPGDSALRHVLGSPRLRSPWCRQQVQRWTAQARAGVAFREDSHFYFTMPLPVLRRALLEIGRRLHGAGVLDTPEEVFHLRLEEIERIADPDRLGPEVREQLITAVRARSARRGELAGVRLIDPRAIFPARDAGNALVVGTPASGGRATGPVRIVAGPADFARLCDGDILVCPYTNPSWTPLFQRAVAVVVDAGGAASHAAIVAREYGLPAVMGTGQGTSVLTDRQVVTVDGDTGRVVPAGA